jgi:hypothetical protein
LGNWTTAAKAIYEASMSLVIKESDWKRFKEIHQIAMDRYAQKCLHQVNYLLTDKDKPAADRFFEIRDAVRDREKTWRRLFEDYRRSTAIIQIMMMRADKLVADEEMIHFSDELRERIEQMLKIHG